LRFIGVDMASQPANTGLVILEAADAHSPLSVVDANSRASDADILEAVEAAPEYILAIDAPLGWPRRFREQLQDWTLTDWDDEIRNELIYRSTDRYVSGVLKLGRPLSVSANLIAIPAMRARALLKRLKISHLDGTDGAYETYPAASLRVWGLDEIRYKGPRGTAEGRAELLHALIRRWGLRGGDHDLLTVNDHVLDALICAITVREVRQHPREIPTEYRADAREEGWIHVPRG